MVGPEGLALLKDLDGAIRNGVLIKDGNSATIARVEVDCQQWVIKRYNIKNFWHWLKRCWRPSRAAVSWRNAHLLEQLGIETPAPIAMLEQRWGWLRGRAYYVSQCIDAIERKEHYRNICPMIKICEPSSR